MLEFIDRSKDSITDEKVCNELLSLNYNSQQFFDFLIVQFTEAMNGLKSNGQQLAFFALQIKTLNQLPSRSLLALNKEQPDIRTQVRNWLSEEIYLLEKKDHFSIPVNSAIDHAGSTSKIHTSLGVSQLSLALKLLVDSGIIINDNYTDLTKIVAQSFRTDRSENISEGSLRNKYYNVEKATADKMKDVVLNLLSLVRKY